MALASISVHVGDRASQICCQKCNYPLVCGSHTEDMGLDYIVSPPLLPVLLWFLLHIFNCKWSFLIVFGSFSSIIALYIVLFVKTVLIVFLRSSSKSSEHLYNYFEFLTGNCLSTFFLVIFLKFCPVPLFGTYSFVLSFYLTLFLCIWLHLPVLKE